MSGMIGSLSPGKEASINRALAKIEDLLRELREIYFSQLKSNCVNVTETFESGKNFAESIVIGFKSLNLENKMRAIFLGALQQALAAGGVLKQLKNGKLSTEILDLLRKTKIIDCNSVSQN